MRYIHTLCAVVLALALVGCSDDVINEQTAARPIVDEAPETITVGFEDEDTRIQLNDSYKTVNDIRDFVAAEREARSEVDRELMTISLNVDEGTLMGIVTDVKQELRRCSALKIMYAARPAGK